jgi:hypothetical protein
MAHRNAHGLAVAVGGKLAATAGGLSHHDFIAQFTALKSTDGLGMIQQVERRHQRCGTRFHRKFFKIKLHRRPQISLARLPS